MATKRTRSDSSTAAIQAMKNATEDSIQPPAHAGLEKKALPFWHDNIRSKALDSWSPSDLLAAAELANNQLYITILRKDLRSEERKKGEAREESLIKDLRKQIVELQRTILAQRRDLQIHSHATNGESRDQRKRNQNDKDARTVADKHVSPETNNNLIAFPKHG
ncbi:terminase [Limnobaculum zhutongyuii]|uniref:Terminase n=1 Tax=Limnobaculum zhutongyuii TaxID=2498113 RepID=A0A411WLZ1_9GAMM|nr:terminase [Limnobaculum zhutongyuii]QBH97167.1 terminase [Limnobaculum zhutongyuii]TQS88426.1 terminase [Limnobaculum zhutongyuii]